MQNFVEKVLEALTQAGVEFIVVGGVSAVLQGVPVVTQDLDLCYRRTPENVRRLASALRSLHPKLRGLPEGIPGFMLIQRCVNRAHGRAAWPGYRIEGTSTPRSTRREEMRLRRGDA